MKSHLQTTCNQLGKPKHGTEICLILLKELLRYYVKHGSCMYVKHGSCMYVKHGSCMYVKHGSCMYVKHGSCMYVAYIDASNVFDRVNHTKLLSKLLKLGVPKVCLHPFLPSGLPISSW